MGRHKGAGGTSVPRDREVTIQLREWLKQNSPDAEQDDPPIRCQLTDLSMGAATSQFPRFFQFRDV